MEPISTVLARIEGQRVYLDTNILVYFLERHEQYFDRVLPFFECFSEGRSLAYTGDAAVAETLYRPYQLDDVIQISGIKAFFADDEFITVLPHTPAAFDLAAMIAARKKMKLIDALHCATAVQAGCQFLLTNDRGFVSSPQLEVILLSGLV